MEKNLKAAIEAVAELFGWGCDWDEDENLELENWSPAGENLYECANAPHVIEDFVRNARDFDIDEHVEMLLEAKRNGLRGVPGASVLVRDAEAIDEMLNDLADALQALKDSYRDGVCQLKYLCISDVRELIEKMEPKGLYITKDGKKYIGIDNRDGNAWTEEFIDADDCICWLYDQEEGAGQEDD